MKSPTSQQAGHQARLRVCHVLTSLDFGGVETRMRVVARTLSDQRHRVIFLAIGEGGSAEAELRKLGFEVICLRAKTSVYSLVTMLAVYSALQKVRPDVVHTHGAEANVHGLVAARILSIPVRIGEEIGVPSHGRLGRFVFRQVYRCAYRVVAISEIVAAALEKLREVDASKVVVIENPVRPINPNAISARPVAGLRLIYVGRLVAWKQVSNVLEALESARSLGIRVEFWIVGTGPERAALEDRAERLGLEQQVHFFGYQDRPEDYVAACNLFVLPSTEREGFCMALVEAMAVGVPAISTAVGIAPSIIENGVNGWLVPPEDASALAGALAAASKLGPHQLEAVGEQARRSILLRGSASSYVAKLERLYAERWPPTGTGTLRDAGMA